jgi:uncharacterized RDD family membrane protein YckC
LRSWWWDYVTVLAWLLIVFLLVGLPNLVGWIDLAPVWNRPLAADAAITLLTVVPYFVYLVLTEAGPAHATWGKRRAHLIVETVDARALAPSRVMLRNLVKVLPWQLGHMGAMRFATGAEPFALAGTFSSISLVLLLQVVGPVVVGRRGLHDVIAGTTVHPEPGT